MARKLLKNLTRGEAVIRFIETYCRVPEGKGVGRPLKLEPFQKKFILAIYDNKRRTRRAILSLARKNGKTALIAAILLAHIAGPEAVLNSQIVSGAMSREQAALVFKLAAKMIEMDDDLRELCRPVPSKRMIVGLARNVEYTAMAAEGSTAHGLSPILAILDEVGQVKGPTSAFTDAILTSQGAHENPLQIFISTQAATDADMLSILIDDALRTKDPTTVCHLYAADPDCDIMDRAQWKKANPALGRFRQRRDLAEQLTQANRLPALENTARNLLLNQRVQRVSAWLAPRPWKLCRGPASIEALQSCEYLTMGLDLSKRNDLTAAVVAGADADGVVHVLPWVFTPEGGLQERSQRDKTDYVGWARDGYMLTTPGVSVTYEYVAAAMRDDLDDLQLNVRTIVFDRWRIDEFKGACERENAFLDAEWVPCGQGYRDMSPRLEAVEEIILGGNLRTGDHPLLNMAAANAISVMDGAGNQKLDKSKSTLRIDPIVAMVMAVAEVHFPSLEPEPDVSTMIG